MSSTFTRAKRAALAVAALLLATSAAASCGDAQSHAGPQILGGAALTSSSAGVNFTTGAALSAGIGIAARDPWTGFWSGVALGAARGLIDRNGGACARQAFYATASGAALGAVGSHLVLAPNFIGYRGEF